MDKCKIQENGIWVNAVRYREFGGETGLFFVRSQKEFDEKFKHKD